VAFVVLKDNIALKEKIKSKLLTRVKTYSKCVNLKLVD